MKASESPRLSPLAMMSLSCGLLSVGACLIASVLTLAVSPMWGVVIVALPLVGAVGAVLGAVALKQIGRSEGRFVGRAFAIVGLFVGIISAVLQGSVAASAAAQVFAIKRDLAPVVESFMLAGARGDRTAQRAALGDGASKALSDERLDWFRARLEERMGTAQGADFGLEVMVRSMEIVRGAAVPAPSGAQTVTENPKPVEMIFARGSLIAFVTPDDDAMRTGGRIAIADVLVMLPDGRAIALLEDGPAVSLAGRLGVAVLRQE